MSTLLERAFLKGLRAVSPMWRARTELFVEPYRQWIDWQSGLGDADLVLHAIVRVTRPRVVVEIGSARGKSTCAIALACAENRSGRVYAIDPHTVNDWTDAGTAGNTFDFLHQRLNDYALAEYCTVIRDTSVNVGRTWSQQIDLLFIDGDHSPAGVRADFENFGRWVHDDGLVVFHDSAWEREGPWERFAGQAWFTGRENMGVPEYLAGLQQQGFKSVTFMPAPGLTVMHPRAEGFDFVRRRPLEPTVEARE